MTIEITEEERQMILLALAHLAVERPGWEMILTETAKKMDNIEQGQSVKRRHLEALKGAKEPPELVVEVGKPVMFEKFRLAHKMQTEAVTNEIRVIVGAAANLEFFLPTIRRTAVIDKPPEVSSVTERGE